jgi:hypothetical protein
MEMVPLYEVLITNQSYSVRDYLDTLFGDLPPSITDIWPCGRGSYRVDGKFSHRPDPILERPHELRMARVVRQNESIAAKPRRSEFALAILRFLMPPMQRTSYRRITA